MVAKMSLSNWRTYMRLRIRRSALRFAKMRDSAFYVIDVDSNKLVPYSVGMSNKRWVPIFADDKRLYYTYGGVWYEYDNSEWKTIAAAPENAVIYTKRRNKIWQQMDV